MKFTFNNIEIKAVYSTTPKKKLDFTELKTLFGKDEIEKVTKVTGIRAVRIADSQTTASDLCTFSAL